MNFFYQTRYVALLLLLSFSLHAAAPRAIYGASQGLHVRPSSTQTYLLHLGAFKTQRNAVDCQKMAVQRTHREVRIVPHHAQYRVVIGPMDYATLHTVSGELMAIKNPARLPKKISQSTPLKPWDWSWAETALNDSYLALQVGAFYMPQTVNNQFVGISGLVGNLYTVTEQRKYNVVAGAGYFVNAHHDLPKNIQLAYGVSAYYLAQTQVAGQVVQENLFNNLSYSYHTFNVPMYAMARAELPLQNKPLALLVDVGIGPNVVQTQAFTEQPLYSDAVPDNFFSGASRVNFSATVGVQGRLQNVYKTYPLECGYRFYYLGYGAIASNTNQLTNILATEVNYAHAVICSLLI